MVELFFQVLSFTKIKVKDRYLGTTFGFIWAVLNPLLMLSLYTFIFGVVLQSKAPGAETSLAYTLWMISGLGPWLSISESLTEATNSIVGNSGLIKNLAFQSEALPIAGVCVGLIPLCVSLAFLFVLMVYDGWTPTWHLIFLIPSLCVHLLLVSGLGLIFSAVNVFFRDFGIMLSNFMLVLMFSTPIFYSVEQYPSVMQKFAIYNPFYVITNNYRNIFIDQKTVDLGLNIYVLVLGLIIFYIGMRFFKKLKGFFEGVL